MSLRLRASFPRLAAYGAAAFLACGAVASCKEDRVAAPEPVTYQDVGSLLVRCVECHGAVSPAAGWRARTFLEAVSCVQSGAPAVRPSDGTAPLLRALDSRAHEGRVTRAERAKLTQWVVQGARNAPGIVHGSGTGDPRSPDFHGRTLRDARWAPMLDGASDGACGRCHDGAPARPRGVTSPAPGAPACTSCHTEPGGVLACSTCHGAGSVASPPRDRCFFPDDAAKAGAHAAHAAKGLACATCHPAPNSAGQVIAGLHGNGSVEIVFDTSRVVPEASYDRATGTCAVSCHDRGGARARLPWNDAKGPLTCNDCHASPPAAHYPGACRTCHREANANGSALTAGPLHLNGKVDLGDGRGACGACHGKPDDPWPATNAHGAHRSPVVTVPVTCATCHPVPQDLHSPGHMNGKVDVVLGGRAAARDVIPSYAEGVCSVACHGARMRDEMGPPSWTDTSGASRSCQGCHRSPPTQHTPSTGCDRSTCHGGETARDGQGIVSITPSGKSSHIDGVFDYAH